MDIEDLQRRVQFRQGSYVVTIPLKMVRALDIEKNQYVRFAVVNGKLVIKPSGSKITRKDLADADKGTSHIDDKEIPSYQKDLEAALKNTRDNRNRLEKLRMK